MKAAGSCFVVIVAAALSGCISTHSYLDPGLHDLSWTTVKAPVAKQSIVLNVEFFRNGERFKRADKEARGAVERALDHSGVVIRAADAPATLKVKVDNIANIAEAAGKGFGTGLTFGAAGSTVTDGYEITIEYIDGPRSASKTYRHAIHSTIGHAKPVTAATPMTPQQAFDQVIEDAMMHFLRDMQSDGLLVHWIAPLAPWHAGAI